MYKYANKHVELLKQLPISDLSADVDFISNVINDPNKYGTYENILKCYYFIATEIWDTANIKPSIVKNDVCIHFFDFVRKREESIKNERFKPIKMLNNVLDSNGKNRHFKKHHGLIVQKKPGVQREDFKNLKEQFIRYARMYNQNYKFYKRNKFDLPEEWVEHLYVILEQLIEKANFFYKQNGSAILTQEMVCILSNQSVFLYLSNLIKIGKNRRKIIRQCKQYKQVMFGEIKHAYTKQHK